MAKITEGAIFNSKTLLYEGVKHIRDSYPDSCVLLGNDNDVTIAVCKTISSVLNDSGPISVGDRNDVSKQVLLDSIWLDMREVIKSPSAKKELADFLEAKKEVI